MENLPNEILFNLIKYNSVKYIEYFLKKNINLDWQKLYYYLYKEKKVNSPYTYPKKYKNEWLNAIVNRSAPDNNKYMKKLKNGQTMVRGNNIGKKLGLNKISENVSKFQLVCDKNKNPIKNIVKIFYGDNFSVALLKTGEIMTCGDNDWGKLGFGDTKDRSYYELVPNVKNVSHVFCFVIEFVFLLLEDGRVMSCGYNDGYGSLGRGDYKTSHPTFKFIQYEQNFIEQEKIIKNIVIDEFQVFMISKFDRVYVCGGKTKSIKNPNKFKLLANYRVLKQLES